MKDTDIETSRDNALIFFERGEEVASTDNFDYAIDLFLEGIRREPDALENGHAVLRKISLLRQAKGGKKPSIVDKIKHKGGKRPIDELVNAEYLLAKDPDNLSYAMAMLSASVSGGYRRTAEWLARLVLSACKASEKPPMAILATLKNKFVELEMFEQAVQCCSMILQQTPDDMNCQTEYKNYSASATIQHGKYDKAGNFSASAKDMDSQQKITRKDSSNKDDDYRRAALEEAMDKYKRMPDVYAHRIDYAQSLADVGDRQMTETACSMLLDWYEQTEDFGYKKLHGEIVIREMRSKLRILKAESVTLGKDFAKMEEFKLAVKQLADFEVEYYEQCCKNYPMELKYKYELGVLLMHRKDFDAAIPLFQQSSRKPGIRSKALNLLGMCFFNKSWYGDAIDVFEGAIKNHPNEDELFKELRYNLARACEFDGRKDRALTIYRKLAQMDYSYRDVAARVNKLRDA